MKNKLFLLSSLLLVLTLVACDEKIPISEFSKTKLAIEKAKSVRAEYYSPKEYKAAEEGLKTAHDVLISKEKPEDSVKESEKAHKNAVEAYNKSVILYAKDTMKKADQAVKSADDAYAEKLSPTFFTQARDLYVAANDKYDNKKYEETIKLSEESYEKAVKAREESLDNKYELQVKIDQVNSVLRKIEGYNYSKYASNEYSAAATNLKKAEQSYSGNMIKNGFAEVEVAKVNADAAYKAVMEGVTAEKIAEAESRVKSAEMSKGAKVASEDLAAAKEALESSKRLKEQGSYNESITYANEAIRLSLDVIEKGKATTVAVKANNKGAGKGKFVKEDENYYYYKVRNWIKYKDCLWIISRKYYKNPRLWKKIHRANKGRIKNPDLIRPGWIIRVPKLKK